MEGEVQYVKSYIILSRVQEDNLFFRGTVTYIICLLRGSIARLDKQGLLPTKSPQPK